MGGLDPAKLLVILVLALVVLGPERLPKAARQLGAFFRDFMTWRAKIEDEVRSALPEIDLPSIPTVPRGGLTGYLTGMMREAGSTTSTAEDGSATEYVAETDRAPVGLVGDSSRAGVVPERSLEAPAGIPVSFGARAGEAAAYASGTFLPPLPVGSPEAVMGAKVRLDLDDPSWN